MLTKDNSFTLLKPKDEECCRCLLAGLLLFGLLLVIYGNSLSNGWHFDDFANIVDNPRVHAASLDWQELRAALSGVGAEGRLQRPLAFLSFAINHALGGLQVEGYHLVNLAIHFLTAFLLFLLLRDLLQLPLLRGHHRAASSVALLAAAFWASSPLQVTAVTYIVQRMAALAALFTVLALFCYLKARTAEGRGRRVTFFLLTGVAGLCGVASKENAAMLAASLFLFDILLIQGASLRALKKNLPFLAGVAALLAVAVFLFTDPFTLPDTYGVRSYSLTERLLTQSRVLVSYLSLLIYPLESRLMLLHEVEVSTGLFSPPTTAGAFLLLAVLAGSALLLARRTPLLSFALLFFLLNHLVEGSVIGLELIYEHRNYLPSLFFFVPLAVLLVDGLDFFSYRPSLQLLLAATGAALLLAQGLGTVDYNLVFRNEFSLWQDNVAKAPGLSRPHNNLGQYYWHSGQKERAAEHLRTALRLDTFDRTSLAAVSHENLGMYYLERREWSEAARHLEESLRIAGSSAHPRTLYGLATVRFETGQLAEAEQFLNQVLALVPRNGEALLLKGRILLRAGRHNEALDTGRRALHSQEPEGFLVQAAAYLGMGRNREAAGVLRAYLGERPNDLQARIVLLELANRLDLERQAVQAASALLAAGTLDGTTLPPAPATLPGKAGLFLPLPDPGALPVLIDAALGRPAPRLP